MTPDDYSVLSFVAGVIFTMIGYAAIQKFKEKDGPEIITERRSDQCKYHARHPEGAHYQGCGCELDSSLKESPRKCKHCGEDL